MRPFKLSSASRHTAATLAQRPSRGVSLIFALLTLMALSLAALALVRSVDTGALVLGNLGFKQEASAVADTATRQAIKWVSSFGVLTKNNGSLGYYATSNDAVDITGQQSTSPTRVLIDWDQDGCAYAAGTDHGSCEMRASDPIQVNSSTTARYVVFRLCQAEGDPTSDATNCARPLNSEVGHASTRGVMDYPHSDRFNKVSGVYYRIVVRVVGARNSVSFIETIVHQ